MPEDAKQVQWQATTVSSPHLPDPIPVVAAKNIQYFPNANRLQNLSTYLPETPSTSSIVATTAYSLPRLDPNSPVPHCLVHIHGGAWRDPNLTSASIEATVAHAFNSKNRDLPLTTIVARNYTLSPTFR